MANRKFAFKGINDDVTVCECCGKRNLKRVVWLAPLDQDGNEVCEPVAYGTTCAAKAMGWYFRGHAQAQRMVEDRVIKEFKEWHEAVVREACKKLAILNHVYVLPEMLEDYKAGKLDRATISNAVRVVFPEMKLRSDYPSDFTYLQYATEARKEIEESMKKR